MIYLLAASRSTDENYFADCDYALVSLDEAYYQKLHNRGRFFRSAKVVDEDLAHFTYWDAGAVWFGSLPENFLSDKEQQEFEDQSYIFLSENRGDELTKLIEASRTEIDKCLITSDLEENPRVAWVAAPKHTSIEVSTEEMSIREIGKRLDGDTNATKD